MSPTPAEIRLARVDPIQRAIATQVYRDLRNNKKWSPIRVHEHERQIHLTAIDSDGQTRRIVPVAYNKEFDFQDLKDLIEGCLPSTTDQPNRSNQIVLAIVQASEIVYCALNGFEPSLANTKIDSRANRDDGF